MEDFCKNFRSPGHVPLLPAAPNLVLERQGHTELSVALGEMAGIIPVMVICEMLDARTHTALSLDDARRYARVRGLPCVSGEEIISAYRRMKGGLGV